MRLESRKSLPATVVDSRSDSPTAGIQEAIDAMPEEGGVVVIPAGRYLIRRSIRLRSRVTLRGEGASTVLTRPAPATFKLIAPCGPDASSVEVDTTTALQVGDEVIIADTVQRSWYSRQFVIHKITGNTLVGHIEAGKPKRSYLPKHGAAGGNYFPMIHIPYCDGVVIESLAIDGGGYEYEHDEGTCFTCMAVHAHGATNLHVRHVTVKGWHADGIGAQRGSNVTVSHCLVEDCLSHGFHPGTNLEQSVWTNNISQCNRTGFFFCLGVRRAIVTDNLFIDNRGSGIDNLTDPDQDNIVQGNVIARNGLYGVDATRSLNNVISNNLVQDNSQRCPGIYPGIFLCNHSGNVVHGNRCNDTQDQPTQYRGLIAEESKGDNVIENNLVTDIDIPMPIESPTIQVMSASQPVHLDASLCDQSWQDAQPLFADQQIEDGTKASAVTEFRLLYDDQHFYIGARCAEPHMDRVFDQYTERGQNVWKENAIEVLLAPDSSEIAYHLSINTLGTVFEKQHKAGQTTDWHSQAEIDVRRTASEWSVAIAIPLVQMGITIIASGMTWWGNFSRNRKAARPSEIAAWSATYGSITQPNRFGKLLFK